MTVMKKVFAHISNRTSYYRHRESTESFIASNRSDTLTDVDLVWRWTYLYESRLIAFNGNRTWPTLPMDRTPVGLLRTRNAHRDKEFFDLPEFPEMVEFLLNFISETPGANDDWNGEPPKIGSVHEYGPSFRQLWNKGKLAGGTDAAAREEVRSWIFHRPKSWENDDISSKYKKPKYPTALNRKMEQSVTWSSTGSLDIPWRAEVDGSTWWVRLNDFPDDYMYSLLIGTIEIGDFHDWPQQWIRPEGPGWVEEPKKPKAASFVIPKDIAAESLPHRYLEGECEAVWADLDRLGPAVRKAPYLEPALAVCREMTRRSRQNLLTIISRLHSLDYQFWSAETQSLFSLSQTGIASPWKQKDVWQLPEKNVVAKMVKLEKKGILLPLVVRVWSEEIGKINLNGFHQTLCPLYYERSHAEIYADPMIVSPIWEILSTSFKEMDSDTEPLFISFQDSFKAEIPLDDQADEQYAVEIPDPMIDAKMNGLWYDANFVQYLRKNFQWGGFPGWERYADRPEKELKYLAEGMLEI